MKTIKSIVWWCYSNPYGFVIAFLCSYSKNNSLLLALFHSLFNWFYIVYFALLG